MEPSSFLSCALKAASAFRLKPFDAASPVDGFLALLDITLSRAARRPFRQLLRVVIRKMHEKSRGCSSSMWLCNAVTSDTAQGVP